MTENGEETLEKAAVYINSAPNGVERLRRKTALYGLLYGAQIDVPEYLRRWGGLEDVVEAFHDDILRMLRSD